MELLLQVFGFPDCRVWRYILLQVYLITNNYDTVTI
jgi:hypothetical protein